MLWYVNALLFVIVGAMPIYFLVGRDAAWVWSMGGMTLVVFGTLAYIVLFHSRKRWPNTTAFQRLVNVLTYSQ